MNGIGLSVRFWEDSAMTPSEPVARKSPARGVLILECLQRTDPGSEGRFLSHMFNLMEVPNQYVEIRTKRQFIAMLGANEFDVVHMTTHGSLGTEDEFVGFGTPEGTVRLKEFPADVLNGKTVVSKACRSGALQFRRQFIKRVAAKYYIAPKEKRYLSDTIFFSHVFYRNLFVHKR
jgi:hypothetical protein